MLTFMDVTAPLVIYDRLFLGKNQWFTAKKGSSKKRQAHTLTFMGILCDLPFVYWFIQSSILMTYFIIERYKLPIIEIT